MDQNKKNKLEACSDSFSRYAKGHTDISSDVTHSTRNFSAYLINIKYYSVRDYFHYWCCYVNPFMVIFMVMLRLAHFNFLHNIYTFPVQPINSLYFLPTDLIYDSVSIGIAFFLFVSVASLPVWYNILAFLMRTTARQLSTCPEILD